LAAVGPVAIPAPVTGTPHGGVYASLIDSPVGSSVAAFVGLRRPTVGAKARDAEDNLVAMGIGTSRIFEKSGNPIV